jgi:hypothetical protein
MSATALRFNPSANASEIESVRSIIEGHGARVQWVDSPEYDRTYGLIEPADMACIDELREKTRAVVLDRPIVALLVVPSVEEAVPLLLQALGGDGRPSGVTLCEPCRDGVLIEWDLDETGLDVVMSLVDIEIDRFRAARVNALLAPLPLSWWTRIAAEGLRAPEITADRVLEEQLEVHGVLD